MGRWSALSFGTPPELTGLDCDALSGYVNFPFRHDMTPIELMRHVDLDFHLASEVG